MTRHTFGGKWTTEKLEILEKYMAAYTTIFARNPRAKYFRTLYVDAFAGTGYRTAQTAGDTALLPDLALPDAREYLKGSAEIALKNEPAFDRYVFIEQKPDHVAELEKLRATYPQRVVSILPGDANTRLRELLEATDWTRHRALVFLDPYGMQVEWSLLEAIARTEAIDLWMLFPLGVGVNRLLTRKGEPPPEWAQALTRIFGTDSWRAAFYRTQTQETLFGTETVSAKVASFDSIGAYLVQRLSSIFRVVSPNPRPLVNSHNSPLYLLCFAAGNARGAATALRIANHILEH